MNVSVDITDECFGRYSFTGLWSGKTVSLIEKQHRVDISDTNTNYNNGVFNLDDNIRDENSVVISNLPESEDHVSDKKYPNVDWRNEYCNVFVDSLKSRTEIIMEQTFKKISNNFQNNAW